MVILSYTNVQYFNIVTTFRIFLDQFWSVDIQADSRMLQKLVQHFIIDSAVYKLFISPKYKTQCIMHTVVNIDNFL